MVSYFEKNGITIYCGDCREIVPMLPAASVDVVLADPPYGETSLEWDRWPDGWLDSLSSVVTPTSSLWCFGSFRMFFDHRDEFTLWKFVQDVIWEKQNGSGFFADRFRRVHETAAHFVRGGCKWADVYKSPQFTMDATARTVRKKNKPAQWHGAAGPTTYVSHDRGPRLQRSVQQVRSMHMRASHPTEKPLGILTPLLQYSCRPGGVVLDPTCGSGSTLIAAKELGLNAVGIEINEEYCEIAANRLRQGILWETNSEHREE